MATIITPSIRTNELGCIQPRKQKYERAQVQLWKLMSSINRRHHWCTVTPSSSQWPASRDSVDEDQWQLELRTSEDLDREIHQNKKNFPRTNSSSWWWHITYCASARYLRPDISNVPCVLKHTWIGKFCNAQVQRRLGRWCCHSCRSSLVTTCQQTVQRQFSLTSVSSPTSVRDVTQLPPPQWDRILNIFFHHAEVFNVDH